MNNIQYWWRYKAVDHVPAAILVIGILFIIFGIYPLIKWANTYECQQYQAVTGRETKMVDLNCYVQYDGEWYKANEVKVIRKTK
jgi:hypothetical protein